MIQSLEQIYAGRMRFVFWEFPLAMHAHAREAAIAAEAASTQRRFWEMHDLLYRNQNSWASSSDVATEFEKFALALHLNIALFQRELRSPATAARVTAQRDYGVSRGVKNTPTLFLNGKELPPTFSPQLLRDEIDAALASKKKSDG
jgi:protein-disulfide isomerase